MQLKQESNFALAASCLAEFAHIVERTELENLWRTDPNRPELDADRPGQDFSPKYTKTVRNHYITKFSRSGKAWKRP